MLGELEWCIKKYETRSSSYSIYQNKLKMRKRLKFKSQYHKNPRGNTGSIISNILYSNIFADISPTAREIKERIKKWDYSKSKSFRTSKEPIIKMKREPTVWENVFAMIHWTRVCSPKYLKNLYDSTPGRQTIQSKNRPRIWIDTSPKRTYRWLIDIWKYPQHHQSSDIW